LSISAANATAIATNSSVITGLSPATAYYYAIVATNINGASMGYISNFTTVALSAAPIVTNLAPSSITASGVKLIGGVNPNNDAAGYWYVYGTNSTLSSGITNLTSTAILAASNVLVSVTNSLSGLLPNTVYYDQIMATNNYGMTSGYISNFTTTVPVPSVVPLVVQSVTAGAATLGAMVNPNNANTGYWFKYGTNNTLTGVNKFTVTNIVAASYSSVIKTLLITGLSPGTVYYYQVGGTNAGGTATSWNNSFTTLPVTPSQLGNVVINGGKLQFSFTNASGASFSILSTTNLTSPWSVIGTAVESPAGSGNYQFTNSLPATNPATFYMWRQP
jgi:phosphodiesterase/alkaline phosphatase D-like protein